MDAVNRDYQLKENSAAIDVGDPANGTNYPGGRVDLGAFEYNLIDNDIPGIPMNLRIVKWG